MLTLGKQGLGSLRKTQNWKDLCDEFFKEVPALGEVQAPSVPWLQQEDGVIRHIPQSASLLLELTLECVRERRQRFAQRTGRVVKH